MAKTEAELFMEGFEQQFESDTTLEVFSPGNEYLGQVTIAAYQKSITTPGLAQITFSDQTVVHIQITRIK